MATKEPDLVNQVINGYLIKRPIGQGKFSIVFKAVKQSDNTTVALKLIKIFDMQDKKQREKWLKEVELLESLDHPHIIKYLDSFIDENEMYIAVEWAERGDLKRIIRHAKAESEHLDEAKVWEYIGQIASALDHMKQKRIMHRDLKPANIFISSEGQLKVGDLGLGRQLSSQTLEAYSRVGTPLYMSPEVLNGEGYDWKSDIWSLGCIAYELCALKSPFKSADEKLSLYDLFNKINKGEYPPLESRYSENLRILIDLMLKVSPEERIDLKDVLKACEIESKKKPTIDPYLIMDDIMEKLKLLNYEVEFCEKFRKPQIVRIYFAYKTFKEDTEKKVEYFYDLWYWLMMFPTSNKKIRK